MSGQNLYSRLASLPAPPTQPHGHITQSLPFCVHETLLTIKGIIKGMHAHVENLNRTKNKIQRKKKHSEYHTQGPGRYSVRASSQDAKVVGLISRWGTYKKEPKNA